MSNKQKKTKQGVPDLGRAKKIVRENIGCMLGHEWEINTPCIRTCLTCGKIEKAGRKPEGV